MLAGLFSETSIMNTPLRVAGLACALLASTAVVARAQGAGEAGRMFEATTLSVSAYGETKIAPDQAVITLGVQTIAPVAAEAMAQNAAQMSAVSTALRRAGIAEKDIQTSSLNLSPQYIYTPNEPAKLTGYQASNDVTITVEDLQRLGPTIDAVTAAGANPVSYTHLR